VLSTREGNAMIVQLQLAADKIIRLMRNRFCAQIREYCVTNEIEFLGKKFLVDHIEIPDSTNTILTSFQGEASINWNINAHSPQSSPQFQARGLSGLILQVSQPIDLYIVDKDKLFESNADLCEPYIPQEIQKFAWIKVFLDMSMTVQLKDLTKQDSKNQIMLTLAYNHIGNDLMDMSDDEIDKSKEIPDDKKTLVKEIKHVVLPIVWPVIEQKVGELMSKVNSTIILDIPSSLQDYMKDIEIVNAGIVYNNNGNFVTIRLEFLEIDAREPLWTFESLTAWTLFYAGFIENKLNGKDWDIFVDQRLLTTKLWNILNENIEKIGGNTFKLQEERNTRWELQPDGQTFRITFPAEVSAPPCSYFGITIGVDLWIDIKISVPAENQIKFTMNWGIHPSAADQSKCSIALGFISGIITSDILSMLIIACIGIFAAFHIMANSYLSNFDMDSYIKPYIKNVKKTGDRSYEGELPFPSQDTPLGWPTLEMIASESKGFLIAGSDWVSDVEPYKLLASIEEFTWGVCGNCNEYFSICSKAFLNLGGLGSISNICEISIPHDPCGQFEPFLQEWYWPVTVAIVIPEYKTDYFNNPEPEGNYPLQILIKTLGGARLVTFKVPQQWEKLSDEERARVEGELEWANNVCKGRKNKWIKDGIFDPHWIPDPPPNEVAEHLWVISLGGIRATESITVRDYEKDDVAIVRPTSLGEVHLNLLLTPSLSSNQITLLRQEEKHWFDSIRNEGMDLEASQGDSNLFIRQILLVQKAILYLNELCSWLSGGWYKGIPAIFAITASGLRVYDLNQPDFPSLIELVPSKGLNGAMPWHRGLLTWGKSGLRLYRNGVPAERAPFEGWMVYDALFLGHNLYVLTDEGLVVLDGALHEIGNMHLPGGRHIGGNGTLLTVNDGYNLHVINVSDPQSPQELQRHTLENKITNMRQFGHFGSTSLCFINQEKEGGALFEIGEGGQPVIVAQFKHDPLYMSTVNLGDVFVHLDPDKRALKIFKMAQVHTL
jgi:hypothetical protein